MLDKNISKHMYDQSIALLWQPAILNQWWVESDKIEVKHPSPCDYLIHRQLYGALVFHFKVNFNDTIVMQF
jgi:hypothetical protein